MLVTCVIYMHTIHGMFLLLFNLNIQKKCHQIKWGNREKNKFSNQMYMWTRKKTRSFYLNQRFFFVFCFLWQEKQNIFDSKKQQQATNKHFFLQMWRIYKHNSSHTHTLFILYNIHNQNQNNHTENPKKNWEHHQHRWPLNY